MFVRGGNITPSDSLYRAGYRGNYWPSVGRNSSSAYNLYFYSGGVYPSDNYTRYSGFSIRCIALGD